MYFALDSTEVKEIVCEKMWVDSTRVIGQCTPELPGCKGQPDKLACNLCISQKSNGTDHPTAEIRSSFFLPPPHTHNSSITRRGAVKIAAFLTLGLFDSDNRVASAEITTLYLLDLASTFSLGQTERSKPLKEVNTCHLCRCSFEAAVLFCVAGEEQLSL